jgi:hypothetical protein
MVQWFRVVQNGSNELWFRSSVVQPPYRGANRLNHSSNRAVQAGRIEHGGIEHARGVLV